ncbi:MAG: hypothetical protein ACRBFS_26990 [Aureispira sp.]
MNKLFVLILFASGVVLETVLYASIFLMGIYAVFVYGFINATLLYFLNSTMLIISLFLTLKRNRVIVVDKHRLKVVNLLNRHVAIFNFENIEDVVLLEKFNGYYDRSYFTINTIGSDSVLVAIYPITIYTKQIIEKLKAKGVIVKLIK